MELHRVLGERLGELDAPVLERAAFGLVEQHLDERLGAARHHRVGDDDAPAVHAQAANGAHPRPRVCLRAGARDRLRTRVGRFTRLHVRLEEHLGADDGDDPGQRQRRLAPALPRRRGR